MSKNWIFYTSDEIEMIIIIIIIIRLSSLLLSDEIEALSYCMEMYHAAVLEGEDAPIVWTWPTKVSFFFSYPDGTIYNTVHSTLVITVILLVLSTSPFMLL